MEILSMTGYGRGMAQSDAGKLTLELRSVNHRFLDLGLKLPRCFAPFEDELRRVLQGSISRGHVDVFVKYERNEQQGTAVRVNEAVIDAYIALYKRTAREHGIKYDIKLSHLMQNSDIFEKRGEDDDEQGAGELLIKAAQEAAQMLREARRHEGQRLYEDLLTKLDAMETLRGTIELRAPLVVDIYRDKLKARLRELIEQGAVDENRLTGEVTVFADRCAVDEEIVRLGSHIKQCRKLLSGGGTVGKQLDFLVQEMNREANTICSKSQDGQITTAALALKNEIEKVREQVQNIE